MDRKERAQVQSHQPQDDVRLRAKISGRIIEFLRDGRSVTKIASQSTIDHANSDQWAVYTLMKIAKEADADLAYVDHGDEWRGHAELYGRWWRPMSKQVFMEIYQDA